MVKASMAACTIFLLAAHAQDLSKAHKVALVIANSKYTQLRPLPSAARDAETISAALKQAGFEVIPVNDFKVPNFFNGEAAEFETHLKGSDVCVIYFAGYTVQVGGENYLLPVNFDPRAQTDWTDRAYLFYKFSETLDTKDVALRIFIVEGPPPLGVDVPGISGIGITDPQLGVNKTTQETYFISAAGPGNTVAPAADGGIDLLTRETAKAINELKLPLNSLFDQIMQNVNQASGAIGQPRVPYHATSVASYSKFYFHEPEKTPGTDTGTPPVVIVPPPVWPRPGVPITNIKDHEEYTWIKAQTFMMGCVPGGQKACTAAEQPRHEVTLTHGFWLGRNEVQVDSYQRYVEQNKKSGVKMPRGPLYETKWKNASFPMVDVKWEEAKAYCTWAGGRLPTEAEWEAAARGGKRDEIYPMNTVGSRDSANFRGKSGNDIYDIVAPVRKFIPNSYGLFDMAGNVWEWVNDFFGSYSPAPVADPKGPASGKEHVKRGGSYQSDPDEHLRISYRKGESRDDLNIGFRCAIDDNDASRALLPQPNANQ